MTAAAKPRAGAASEEFGGVCRFWDPRFQCAGVKIHPGEYYVTGRDELVTTILGSCVAACIRDRLLGLGGMNHFLVPARGGGEMRLTDTHYGEEAMEHLIEAILRRGGQRRNLELKLFGGGRMDASMGSVGQANVAFAVAFAESAGIRLLARDVGGEQARKVIYFPRSGRVLVRKLPSTNQRPVAAADDAYLNSLLLPGGVAREN